MADKLQMPLIIVLMSFGNRCSSVASTIAYKSVGQMFESSKGMGFFSIDLNGYYEMF